MNSLPRTLAFGAVLGLVSGALNLMRPFSVSLRAKEPASKFNNVLIAASAENNTVKRPLVLGQSLPLTGPSGQLGLSYLAGANAWFSYVNSKGGIYGRKIKLISLDDQYEPDQTLRNTKKLLDPNQLAQLCSECGPAIALFGYVGTPTTKVILPMVENQKIPLVAPMTGASLLRDPKKKMIFNLRASYRMEIKAIVNSLVREARHRIAVVYQNDAFGEDGLKSAIEALNSHKLKPVLTTTVERNSDRVEEAMNALMSINPPPNGIIVVSAYVSSAALSSRLRSRGLQAQMMNVSFVGTKALQKAMPVGQANGIGVAQVVPFPWNRWIPIVAEYQSLMRRSSDNPSFGFTSFEGFLAARFITEGLERAGVNPSRIDLKRSLESIKDMDLGGFRMDLSSTDHQASDFVELTFLGSHQWEP